MELKKGVGKGSLMDRKAWSAFLLGLLVAGVPLAAYGYALNRQLSGLENELGPRDQQLAGLQGQVDSLNETVTGLQEEVARLQEEIDAPKGTAGINITREEAIEISRNTTTVQEALEDASKYDKDVRVAAEYWSATYIRSLKQSHPDMVEWKNLPEDHGVWKVTWQEYWEGLPSGDGIYILHFIDELTGEILFESALYFG